MQSARNLCLIICLTGSIPLWAHELNTTLQLRAERSNNIARVPSPLEESQLEYAPGIRIEYLLAFSRVDANFAYNLQQVNYFEDRFDDRFEVIGEGAATWQIIDRILSWQVFQTSNRMTIDSREPDNPENQTGRSVAGHGPTLQFALTPRTRLQISAQQNRTSFDDTQALSTGGYTRTINLQQRITPNVSLGLSAESLRSQIDHTNFSYGTTRYSVVTNYQSEKYNHTLAFGRNIVARSFEERTGGGYYNLSFAGTLQDSDWSLNAVNQLTDSQTGLAQNGAFDDQLNSGDGNFDAADIVERVRYEARYGTTFGRIAIQLAMSMDRQNFKVLPRDQVSRSTNVTFNYRLTPRAQMSLSANQNKIEFEEVAGEAEQGFQNRSIRVDVRYALGTRMNITAWFTWNKRSALTKTSNFDVSVRGFSLTYRL